MKKRFAAGPNEKGFYLWVEMASQYADMKLAVRQEEPWLKESDAGREGGRESDRERAEVVGEAGVDNSDEFVQEREEKQ